MTEGEIVEWNKKQVDRVKEVEILFDLIIEKLTV
jgi:pyruvate/2-oxoglutarate dehydrogenase complex dihydrolipoamide acyltransferase (E2) component